MEISADILFLIPARGGSKGLPGKNTKLLKGKPLICYAIDAARELTEDKNICVSSDDEQIIKVVEDYGLKVPFIRPAYLATDKTSSNEVILHAINYYKNLGLQYKSLILLQPTSPFRTSQHIYEAIKLFSFNYDLVVSVKITSSNPYYVLFEENKEGYLELSKKGNFVRRQDCPIVYEKNGAIYIYNLYSFNKSVVKQKKYLMDDISSIDIDNEFDWKLTEFIIYRKENENN